MFKTAVVVALALFVALVQCQGGSMLQCNSYIVLNCSADSIQEHGGMTGACNAKNYCIVEYPGSGLHPNGTTGNPPAISYPPPPIQQCANNAFYNLGGFGYQAFCNFDCKYNHGADNGTCDFVNKKCKCGYPANVKFDDIQPNLTIPALTCVGITSVFASSYQKIVESSDFSNDLKLTLILGLISEVCLI